MSVPLEVVNQIATTVAAERKPEVEAIAIASADGESGRVELLVSLTSCPDEPCRILLNINRNEPEALEQELRSKLADAIATADAGH